MGYRKAPVDTGRLRRSVPLPSFQLGTTLDLDIQQLELGDSATWPDRIAALRRALRTNPGDTERRFELARLLTASEDKTSEAEARIVARETEAALRRTPKSAALLVRLGRAQFLLGDHTKAETTLRRATTLAPNDPQVWLALGETLSDVAHSFPTNLSASEALKQAFKPGLEESRRIEIIREALQRALTPAQLAAMKRRWDQAKACWDRTLALAPGHPTALLNKARYADSNFWELMMQVLESRDPQMIQKQMLKPGFLAALQEVSTRLTDNPKIIGVAGLAGYVSACTSLPDTVPNETHEDFNRLGAAVKEPILSAIARLEPLARSGNLERRRRALEIQGVLHLITHNMEVGRRRLEEARKLGALSSDVASLRAVPLMKATPPDHAGAEAVLRDNLKSRPTPQNQRSLARMLLHNEKFAEGQAVLEAALKQTPNDTFCLLSLAGCQLKQGNLLGAERTLKKAERWLLTDEYQILQTIQRGILLGLGGKTELARDVLKKALARDPENSSAKEALAALE